MRLYFETNNNNNMYFDSNALIIHNFTTYRLAYNQRYIFSKLVSKLHACFVNTNLNVFVMSRYHNSPIS